MSLKQTRNTKEENMQEETSSNSNHLDRPDKGSETGSVTMPAKEGRDKEDGAILRNVTLATIPDYVWKRVARPSFHARHPVLAVLLLCLALGLAFGLGKSLNGESDMGSGEPSLALVSVKGPILDVSRQLEWVDKIEGEDNIRGVVLRVDSPGGGAAASQELYEALKRLGKTKPIVVSMGSTAASGGLMVSMAGERVFANASTVTGSIGVRMDIPQLQKLMNTIGVGKETLTTAPYKDAGSPLRPLTEKERAYLDAVLRDMHSQFVSIVAQGRKMTQEQAAALADGRIFTGREAREKGLVDEIGGMREAIDWLAEKTGVDRRRELVERPEEGSWLSRQLSTMTGALFARGMQSLQEEATRPQFLYMW